MAEQAVEPLKHVLESIVARLSAIECKVGIDGGLTDGATRVSPSKVAAQDVEDTAAVKAYKEHISKFITPLVGTCDKLAQEDTNMKSIGSSIQNAWEGIGSIVELASNCKKPAGGTPQVQQALMPHLKQTQDAISTCRQIRLDRDFENHQKALIEMCSAVSWILMFPPPTSPSNHVKETLGAMEFYSNKVRKQYKGVAGKEDHISFCDQTKAIILDLTTYTKEYHFLGLTFNAKGCASLEDGVKILASKEGAEYSKKANNNVTDSKETSTVGSVGALMSELANKRTSDGSSAATGLKRVTKAQQTWRKEFNSTAAVGGVVTMSTANVTSATALNTINKPPVCEFDKIGQRWKVEYQTKESTPHLKLEVKGVKEQVYIYKCSNMTVEVSGKMKAIIVDGCSKVNVVFGTAISGFEVVNSKRIQVQTLGVCPTISIDKTDGCMVYLSKDSMETTSFMTSKSSEMNVCWADENGEMLESPIPEQFQHKLVNGSITSTVSDLYH